MTAADQQRYLHLRERRGRTDSQGSAPPQEPRVQGRQESQTTFETTPRTASQVFGGVQIQTIVVLRLTPETHGNAYGIGMADVTTQEVLEGIDFAATYTTRPRPRCWPPRGFRSWPRPLGMP